MKKEIILIAYTTAAHGLSPTCHAFINIDKAWSHIFGLEADLYDVDTNMHIRTLPVFRTWLYKRDFANGYLAGKMNSFCQIKKQILEL